MTIQFPRMFSVDSPKAIMADEFGYLNGINYMAAHTIAGVGDLCGKSTPGCRGLCLGWYSGQAGIVSDLEQGINNVRDSRIRKAKYFQNDRKQFMSEMTRHIEKLAKQSKRLNKKLAIRPNGSTDIAFEKIKTDNGQTLPELFPNVQFIDYTKHLKRVLDPKRPSNYHITFSLAETNQAEAKTCLDKGFNVAAVFDKLPSHFMGHKVINGMTHDLRHLDPSPCIVGLEPKGRKAKNDTTGFVIRSAGY